MCQHIIVMLLIVLTFSGRAAAVDKIKVVVWDERQPAQKRVYANFLGNHIAEYLRLQPGLTVKSVTIDDPEQGLSKDVLDNCDVLIWWGHVRNKDVTVKRAQPIVDRIKQGRLSMIALHSAHWATPFVLAMHERAASDALAKLPKSQRKTATVRFTGDIIRRAPKRTAMLTPSVKYLAEDGTVVVEITRPNCCFPAYRPDGKSSEIRTLLPKHPIAKGIPKRFTVAHTEMYDEPFHVPAPDAVVFEEHWEAGEHFRSGSVWKVGKGRVFYFRPGHEIFGVYSEPLPLKIVENAVRWLGTNGNE